MVAIGGFGAFLLRDPLAITLTIIALGLGILVSPAVVGASRALFDTIVPGFPVWAASACALIFVGVFLPKQKRNA